MAVISEPTSKYPVFSIPENTNFLQINKFSFVFPTLPFLSYFLQTVTLPGFTTNAVRVDTPFSATYRHGDTLEHDQLTITAILDEDLRVYEETHKWLQALTAPKEFPQYVRNLNGDRTPYHDGVLTINTNANNPNLRLKFSECHPVTMTGINLTTTDTADTTLTTDITFQFDLVEITRLP